MSSKGRVKSLKF
ncbi:hypothetical protein KBC70_03385 [Candidatus Woesebacteria bacterium]|nr:hypothetical protein [Candidatus Woesebacteria bacterium]